TGVHASAQLAHFDLPVVIPARGMLKSLNSRLPEAIRIRRVDLVRPTFHAQKFARAKLYSYRIRWMDCPPVSPWTILRSAILRRPADLRDLRTALGRLQGIHDWASFSVNNPEIINTRRRIFSTGIKESRHGIRLDFKGDGFLRYQVRRMVGALLQVAWRHHDLEWFENLTARPAPGSAVFNAPPRGLTLEKIYLRTPSVGGLPEPIGERAMVHSPALERD
ncbi:MAG: hypothetical protein K8R59_11435, partial [Thermoanaerobaculales bacterium]|nr:hypothetical protein [Thermoanaerobaculales bacterium]